VLAFPCNQFGAQEPGTNDEILAFARSKYGVTFPMFAKIEVNGDGACELYRWLEAGHPDAEGNEAIAWNFTKFLIDRSGRVVARWAPPVTPEEIGAALANHL
jgi:glutathione peroxidase